MRRINYIVILLLFTINTLAQPNSFVVITFEVDRNKDMHGTFVYNWIITVDSIKTGQSLVLYPVYLINNYASNDFQNCCDGKPIDLYTYTTATKFEFTDNYQSFKQQLRELVFKHRKAVQTITKTWNKGYREVTKVYATPIAGEFCQCKAYGRSLNFTAGRDILYLPNQNTSLLETFWGTDKAEMVRYFDYSQFDYRNSEYRTSK